MTKIQKNCKEYKTKTDRWNINFEYKESKERRLKENTIQYNIPNIAFIS